METNVRLTLHGKHDENDNTKKPIRHDFTAENYIIAQSKFKIICALKVFPIVHHFAQDEIIKSPPIKHA